MAPTPHLNVLLQVKVAQLSRGKQIAELIGSSLSKACYELDQAASRRSLDELRECGLMEAGLVYTSEVRPLEDRPLNLQERRHFQTEIGCQPLLLTCLGCVRELEQLRAGGAGAKEQKAVQEKTGEIIKLLVSNGAQLDQQDVGPLENMSLHLAASAGANKLLSLLLLLGADPTGVNSDGWSAEVLAKRAGHTVCEQILQVACMNRVIHASSLEEKPKKGTNEKKGTRAVEVSQEEMEQNILEREIAEVKELDTKSVGKKGMVGTSYGPGGQWSLFDAELHPGEDIDELDSLDERDENELHEEDWASFDELDPKDPDNFDLTAEDFESDGEEDNQIRSQVLQLRQENTQALKSFKNLVAERTKKLGELEQLEARAAKLGDRLSALRDRRVRRDAGDPKAAEEVENETQVGAWWEERATEHARITWELTEQLDKLQQRQQQEAKVPETQLRQLQRQTKGLEEYWAQLFEAEISRETINRIGSEQHAKKLQKEVAVLVNFQAAGTASPSSPSEEKPKKQLPRVLRPRAADATELELVPVEELVVGLEAHRRVHAAKAEFQTRTNELIEFCNGRIADKHSEVEALVEEKLLQTLLPKFGVAESAKTWHQLSALARRARQRCEELASQAAAAQATVAPGSPSAASSLRQRKRAPTPAPRGRPARTTLPMPEAAAEKSALQ